VKIYEIIERRARAAWFMLKGEGKFILCIVPFWGAYLIIKLIAHLITK